MPLLSTHIFKKFCSFLIFLIYLHRCAEIQVFLSVLQQKPSQALPLPTQKAPLPCTESGAFSTFFCPDVENPVQF